MTDTSNPNVAAILSSSRCATSIGATSGPVKTTLPLCTYVRTSRYPSVPISSRRRAISTFL